MTVQRTYPKRADQAISWPVDFGPWLSYINSTLQSISVGDAPDIVETYSQAGNVVTLALAGGLPGVTYRIPVTAVAVNLQTKTYIVECDVVGVAPTSSFGGAGVQDSLSGNSTTLAPSVRAVNAALAGIGNNIDGGTPSSPGAANIDGGGP